MPKKNLGKPQVDAAAAAAQKLYSTWSNEINIAEKDPCRITYVRRGEKILKRYREELTALEAQFADSNISKYNILYSTVETLKPAILNRDPKLEVERRRKQKDIVTRAAAMGLEAAINFVKTEERFFDVLKMCRDDYLLPGMGQAWVRFKPEFEVKKDLENKPYEAVSSFKVCIDHVNWKDFLISPAREWSEVRWVARRVFLMKPEIKEQFGEEIANQIQLDHTPINLVETGSNLPLNQQDEYKKAVIWEIWDKTSKKVIWWSSGYSLAPLKVEEPLVKFKEFFPCPRPARATCTSDSIYPIADFEYYKDQARALDLLSTRKTQLIDMLKVQGVYDASREELARLTQEGTNGTLIPVKDWPGFTAQGGFNGVMAIFPLAEIAGALLNVYQAEDSILTAIYQINGVADVMRGYTAPQETATAVNSKGRFAAIRLEDRQAEIERFGRDILQLVGEVIAEQGTDEQVAAMADLPLDNPEVLEVWRRAMALLRNDPLRNFKIGIETDSTIQLDAETDKQQRTEFLSAVGSFLNQAAQLAQISPAFLPVAGDLLMFAVRGFKIGRELEGSIENAVETWKQQAAQPQQQGPSPEELQMQLEQAKLQQLAQIEANKMQLEQAKLQTEQQKAGLLSQIEQAKLNAQIQLDQAKLQLQNFVEQLNAQAKERDYQLTTDKLKIEIAKLHLEEAKASNELELKATEANSEAAIKQVKTEIEAKYVQMEQSLQAAKMQIEKERILIENYEKLLEEKRLSMDMLNEERARKEKQTLPPIHINVDAKRPGRAIANIKRNAAGDMESVEMADMQEEIERIGGEDD